jgi:hypothetical protein
MANFTPGKDSSNYRTYHLRVPVRSYFWESIRGEQVYGRTPPPAPAVALEIGAVKGVQSFYVHEGYDLVLQKAESYSWAEIENEIASAIEKHDQKAVWPAFGEPESGVELPNDTDNLEDDEDYEDFH